MKEAIVKQNLETNFFVVFFYYKHDTPSGCTRWIEFAYTDDMDEFDAIKIADEFNNKNGIEMERNPYYE